MQPKLWYCIATHDSVSCLLQHVEYGQSEGDVFEVTVHTHYGLVLPKWHIAVELPIEHTLQ